MGTITININDETERLFRERVNQIYGKRKGVLGKAIAEAVMDWGRKKKNLEICMKLLNEGVKMGKIKYKNRGELYERS